MHLMCSSSSTGLIILLLCTCVCASACVCIRVCVCVCLCPTGHWWADAHRQTRLAERHAVRLPDLQVLWDLTRGGHGGRGRHSSTFCLVPPPPLNPSFSTWSFTVPFSIQSDDPPHTFTIPCNINRDAPVIFLRFELAWSCCLLAPLSCYSV